MYLVELLLLLSSCIPLLSFEISRGVNESLYEPNRINLTYTGATLTLYVRLCNYSVTDSNGLLYIKMTRYCYCTDETDIDNDSCSYPAPILEMKSNTSVQILIVNQLTGINSTNSTEYMNEYKDMDTTNLHVHGVHVSPLVDNVLVTIEPSNNDQHLYEYDIPFHYPGTHWYHAHHHGSTTYQINAGLHGPILMTSDDPYEIDIRKYKENVLMFNWMYAVPASVCNNNKRGGINNAKCGGYDNYEPRFPIQPAEPNKASANYAMCDIYCSSPPSQLNASGYVYDVETNISSDTVETNMIDHNLMLFFTNGQISPIIYNLTVGIYHRLRFINALSNWYLMMKFPDECNWHLIATDGIYIDHAEYMNYNLNKTSHLNELLIPSGGRADVMVRCNESGIYPIYSSNNTAQDPTLYKLHRVYSGRTLFSIQVNERMNDLSSYNGTDSLPTKYPNKTKGTYIEDLSELNVSTGLETQCICNRDGLINETDCSFTFDFGATPTVGTVNNKTFGITKTSSYPYLTDALTIIIKNRSYEFTLNNGVSHVYHQHINPFQITTSVGNNGFIALPNTWWDTIGNYPRNSDEYIKIRFWTRDYDGLVIIHCHLLQHEDNGMMGFYDILDISSYQCPYITMNNTDIPINNTYFMSSTEDLFSTTNNNVEDANNGWFGLSLEIWIGIIVATVVVILIILALLILVYVRRKRSKKQDASINYVQMTD